MDLTEEEVLQILNLIEKSSFDLLQLEVGDLKLTVSKGAIVGNAPLHAVLSEAPAPSRAAVQVEEKKPEPKIEPQPVKAAQPAATDGLAPIHAPMVGTFYNAPAPGSPPFVKVGQFIDEEATVGLIEVMKVFNAVSSGVKGVITDICVQNGQFVEYGQTLLLVRPKENPD